MYHIPVLDSILKKSLTEKPIYFYNSKEMENLYKSIILLSMRFYSVAKFKSTLNFLSKEDLEVLKNNVRYDHNLLLNVRSFVYALIQNKVKTDSDGVKLMIKFNLLDKNNQNSSSQNLDLLRLIKDTGILNSHFKQIQEFPQVLMPAEAKALCQKEVKSLMPQIKNFTYRKLRFIANSNNCTMEDLHSSLVSAVCVGFYNLQSNYRGKHLTNFLKRTIKGTGNNLIKYYTAKSRQRLVSTEDGFTSKVVSTSIGDSDEEKDVLDFVGSEDSNLKDIELRTSLFFQKKQVQEKYGEKSNQARLLEILSNDSKDFVKWYNKQRGTKFKTVISIQEEEEKKFLKVVRVYFGLDQNKWDALLKNIKPRIVDLLGDNYGY